MTPVLGELEFSHTLVAGGAKMEVRVLIRSWFKTQAAHRFAGRGREGKVLKRGAGRHYNLN